MRRNRCGNPLYLLLQVGDAFDFDGPRGAAFDGGTEQAENMGVVPVKAGRLVVGECIGSTPMSTASPATHAGWRFGSDRSRGHRQYAACGGGSPQRFLGIRERPRLSTDGTDIEASTVLGCLAQLRAQSPIRLVPGRIQMQAHAQAGAVMPPQTPSWICNSFTMEKPNRWGKSWRSTAL